VTAAAGHALRLLRDRLDPGARLMLPALNRVLYVLEGAVSLDGADLHANEARHAAGACTATAGGRGATVLRYELVGPGAPAPAGVVVLEHAIRLDPAAAYLMRCDRVDFDRGGEALPHRHQGGGIRCLIAGGMELRIEGEPDRTIKPGQAWFESGREAVHARASAEEATSFIRCAILPREIRGQSSILYVDPAHAAVKPRRYTVFVDEPIALA
jgi:quercetin dioxygenase-like cupin family protein